MPISRERAERIARAHACPACLEYTWRKVSIREPSVALRAELKVAWTAALVCGVCGHHVELGIEEDGDIAYSS